MILDDLLLINRKIDTKVIGKTIKVYPSLPSTMDKIRQFAMNSADEGLVVVALKQTEGRGRMGRKWITGEGGLAASVLLRPVFEPQYEFIMLGGLAVLQTCKTLGVDDCGLKWPNDVLAGEKKIAGVLVEYQAGENGFYIVGMGININQAPDVTQHMTIKPGSLAHQLGKKIDITDFFALLLINFDRLYREICSGHSPFQLWKQNLITLGQGVCVKTHDREICGLALDVNADGSLMIKTRTGEIITVIAGDVSTETGNTPPV